MSRNTSASCRASLVRFEAVRFEAPGTLNNGAELDILIVPAQSCRVRVVHEDAQSLTFCTLDGHPEAGRITFGAYRNPAGDVVFHIRSRARSASVSKRLGFLALGDAMQTHTWSDFITNTAAAVGAHVRDAVRAETRQVEELPEDCPAANGEGAASWKPTQIGDTLGVLTVGSGRSAAW